MIVLKHLAREFKCDPYKLRCILREKFEPLGGRWRWAHESDPQLKEIKEHLAQRLSKDTHSK